MVPQVQSAEQATPPPVAVPFEVDEPWSIFDTRQKALIIFIVTMVATFSGFASNIYFPALPTIADDLDVSIDLVNLTVTTYLIFQALAPSLWGPISDVKGRRVAYCGTLFVFLGACIGLAGTKNYATLIVLRCLQSTGSASTIAIGSGVVGDITTRAERGGFIGIFQAGLLVPVAVGPIIGGALAGSLGWRSVFWFLTIYCAFFLTLLVLLLPETLRCAVGNGGVIPSKSPFAKYPLIFYQNTTKVEWNRDAIIPGSGQTKKIDLTGPLRILITKHAAPIIIFLSIQYAIWQMTLTAMTTLFKTQYGLSETQVGLAYIANGVGSVTGTLVTGRLLDYDYAKVKKSYELRVTTRDAQVDSSEREPANPASEGFPLEKARLRLLPPLTLLQCAFILVFGWSVNYSDRVHIAVPIVATFVTGWTAISVQSPIMTYLVDIFPGQSAAATASLNLARCLCGAAGTSFVMPMINGVGVGVAFTICAVVGSLALAGAGVQWRFGARWRRQVKQEENTGS